MELRLDGRGRAGGKEAAYRSAQRLKCLLFS